MRRDLRRAVVPHDFGRENLEARRVDDVLLPEVRREGRALRSLRHGLEGRVAAEIRPCRNCLGVSARAPVR